jgi:glyoxylase-like metal-dependent hydrolase (beta-lactamase superfamily II)
MKIEKISKNILKFSFKENFGSNIYQINDTLIDLSSYKNTLELIKKVNETKIKKIIFTHLHHDHIGIPSLFKRAKFYASKEEIEALKKYPLLATYSKRADDELKKIKLIPLPNKIDDFEIIKTPGHTIGSICLFLRKQGILFSGDTIFNENLFGRTDLATSVPNKMQDSILKLKKLKIKILCPGHGYTVL